MDDAAEAFGRTCGSESEARGGMWVRGHADKHSDNLSARACWFLSLFLPHLSTLLHSTSDMKWG